MKINHEIRDKAALDNAIVLREIANRMLSEANRSNRTLDSIFYAHLLTSCADFLDDFRKENAELRAQLVAFQKAANPAVAVDPAAPDGERTCYIPFVTGARVFLKSHPDQHGTVVDSFIHSRAGLRCHVCFDDECNRSRWVNAKNLELVPDK
ncbi:hypothetical protein AHY55_00940 [Salmonella enterica subsp. enterica]|nr:hypothetical protein [Salmonella enterica]ECI2262974.1 hypothetical protein [Salmonella enterica subsp. enterica serovar Wandsworth]